MRIFSIFPFHNLPSSFSPKSLIFSIVLLQLLPIWQQFPWHCMSIRRKSCIRILPLPTFANLGWKVMIFITAAAALKTSPSGVTSSCSWCSDNRGLFAFWPNISTQFDFACQPPPPSSSRWWMRRWSRSRSRVFGETSQFPRVQVASFPWHTMISPLSAGSCALFAFTCWPELCKNPLSN